MVNNRKKLIQKWHLTCCYPQTENYLSDQFTSLGEEEAPLWEKANRMA